MGKKNQNISSKHEIIRDEHGQFIKGSSGNPGGRPTKHLTKLLRNKLDEILIADGLNMTIAEHMIDQAVKLAYSGDMQAIKWIFERVEGRPIPMKIEILNQQKPIRILDMGFTESLKELADDEVIMVEKDGSERIVNKREFDTIVEIG